tara:strand:- start:985 stop:1182 length:198 start_codon:yes stop_codon:yes gene_type:complete
MGQHADHANDEIDKMTDKVDIETGMMYPEDEVELGFLEDYIDTSEYIKQIKSTSEYIKQIKSKGE